LVRLVRFDASLLDSLLEASRRNHPDEFFAVLGGEVRGEEVIVDSLLIVPFEASDTGAVFDLMSVHLRGAVGTFHSHPYGEPVPSEDDLLLFRRLGAVHAIAAYPYDRRSVRFYDKSGRNITGLVALADDR
jgi:proteasome lid subunit RPN8/RPN11